MNEQWRIKLKAQATSLSLPRFEPLHQEVRYVDDLRDERDEVQFFNVQTATLAGYLFIFPNYEIVSNKFHNFIYNFKIYNAEIHNFLWSNMRNFELSNGFNEKNDCFFISIFLVSYLSSPN